MQDVFKYNNKRILVISDMHHPYSHPDTVAFLRAIKKKYRPTRVVCMGDEVDCFPKDAEILTEVGFMTFPALMASQTQLKVAQYNEDGTIDYVIPEAYVDKPYNGKLLRIEHGTYMSMTTPNHMIVKENPETGEIVRREASDTKGSRSWYIPRFGSHSGPGIDLSNSAIKLQVAFQADGTIDRNCIKFCFRKERKIDRLVSLLKDLDIEYTYNVNGENTVIQVYDRNVPSYISKEFDIGWLTAMNSDQRDLFVNELALWDGTPTPTGIRYSSMNDHNRNFVHALAVSSGLFTGKISDGYVNIHLERTEKTSQKSATFTDVDYSGNVYCVQVPSSMIIVRQEGHVTVSGNCHAMSFHDSDPDLPSAGDELRLAIEGLNPIYKMFPKVDLVSSNHGDMAYRRAKHHGLPVAYIRDYGEVLQAPKGWVWHNDLYLRYQDGPHMYFAHGISADVMKVVAMRGVCVIQGHYHSTFKIGYLSNPANLLWGMQTGCLVDQNRLNFEYAKLNLKRFIIGCGIIIDGQPQLLPMLLNSNGEWTGKL